MYNFLSLGRNFIFTGGMTYLFVKFIWVYIFQINSAKSEKFRFKRNT